MYILLTRFAITDKYIEKNGVFSLLDISSGKLKLVDDIDVRGDVKLGADIGNISGKDMDIVFTTLPDFVCLDRQIMHKKVDAYLNIFQYGNVRINVRHPTFYNMVSFGFQNSILRLEFVVSSESVKTIYVDLNTGEVDLPGLLLRVNIEIIPWQVSLIQVIKKML